MFENIEKARHQFTSSPSRVASEEFFKIIKELKQKNNHEEASRLLLEIATKSFETNDKKLIYFVTENIINEIKDLKVKDFENFYLKIDELFMKAKILYKEKDEQFDMVGGIAETQANYYENFKKDSNALKLEAAKNYGEWFIKILSKARLREEDILVGEKAIQKASQLYSEIDQVEKVMTIYGELFRKQIDLKNETQAERILDLAVEYLLKLEASEAKIISTTEEAMNIYVNYIENKIADILNPELPIAKTDSIIFENNIATRIIKYAKDICLKRNAKPAILILAKELSLIGLAIFEKGFHELGIPYYNEAKDYYLEVGNNTETITFGNNIISLGLQLYTNERYPIGRDYFKIAIEIGQKIDRNFEVSIYQKQSELLLKYKKYQLAYESLKPMVDPLLELSENDLREDIPSYLRQLARERFEKNDFHYAELFYRLSADFLTSFNQVDLAAETLDAAWPSMFKVRQLQTGIDLATKAADAYAKAGKEEEAADVYIKLAELMLKESHFDLALDRFHRAAKLIPLELREQKFKPLVQLTTKYTSECLKQNDLINAKELWKAACEFNETLARSLIKRDINLVVEIIEDHINNVRKFNYEELNDVTLDSARGSGKVLSEAGENERAARIMVSFATDFLRKNLSQYADPLFEDSAEQFIKANQPEEAARILSALARYHSDNKNHKKSINYYLKASVESKMKPTPKIFDSVVEDCIDNYTNRLSEGKLDEAIEGFETAIKIEAAIDKEAAARAANEIAKKFSDIEKYELAIKYYKLSIENYLPTSIKKAIIVSAEVIEKGREIFERTDFINSNNLIQLGIETLQQASQLIQAAQTARIEGEKFLKNKLPQFGFNLLNKAIELYKKLDDKSSSADTLIDLANYYISANELNESLNKFNEAGTIYLQIKAQNNLRKSIDVIVDFAIKITTGEIISTKAEEKNKEKMARNFFNLAEDFSLKLNDRQLNSDIKYKEWTIFSNEKLHESAFLSLQKTYDCYSQLKNPNKMIELSNETLEFSSNLISQGDLSNANKYLKLTIETLLKIGQQKHAAGICINVCETFLGMENNELAVSWGLRGAEILIDVKSINEALEFIEELADQLINRNSIENAILCYGKIAKTLEENKRMKEVEETALKVMAFGTANMKSNNPAAGLRLWEVALTIGSIVGEEFTGRLCGIEGQTFYEIKNYEKSISLFKESFSLFRRVNKNNRLINLGNTIFTLIEELQKRNEFDVAFKYLPLAFESMTEGNELLLATEKMFTNAKNYIETGKDKEGTHIINSAIDSLFLKGDPAGGIEKCFIGAALLISYGRSSEGSKLLDKGMEKISQVKDELTIKHLGTVCRNQGIILREDGKLEASHIILASGIAILRTINDLIGIGLISIDLGNTLIKRNEMNAAVEAFRNGIQLLAQGQLIKEAADVINELLTEGRKQIDNKNTLVGVPLVELAGELFIILKMSERVMVISEIFINLGGKMLNERDFNAAAFYFSKAMELAIDAGLSDYLPKVGNRCIDFGLKLIKEGDPILGIQFMNSGSELISEFEDKSEKAGRASGNYIEAIIQVLSPAYEKSIENEEQRLELITQFIESTIKFFLKINAFKSFEKLSKLLLDYGKKLLTTKDPKIVRRIFEPALRSAEQSQNPKLLIEIANTYLEHVNYLINKKEFEHLDTTTNQTKNIFLQVNDLREIRKFIGIMAQNGRELALVEDSKNQGIKIFQMLSSFAETINQQELYPVILIPAFQLNDEALTNDDYDLVIFTRQIILKLLRAIQLANYPFTILGNISLSNMIYEWYKVVDILMQKTESLDQIIKIIEQSLQLAVIIQQVELGLVIFEKTNEIIENALKKKSKSIDILFEILAIALKGLNQKAKVIEVGIKCQELGKDFAEKRRLKESIDFLKVAGRIFALFEEEKLITNLAITSAGFGDMRIKEKNTKEGLYYYAVALENYELSKDEKSIELIASSIENLYTSVSPEDGYISFLVPGMVYANRDKIKEAEKLADKLIKECQRMLKLGKKEVIFDSIPYLFGAADIYERTGNFIEETKIYDINMFKYLEATGDAKILDLFLDMLVRSILKKLQIWDFNAIDNLIKQIKDSRVLKNKRYQAISKSLELYSQGNISLALTTAHDVNILFERNMTLLLETYKTQIKEQIIQTGKLGIHEFMEKQPITELVNVLIQDLYARKEIEGKYFPIGLFVTDKELRNMFSLCDDILTKKGKINIIDIAKNIALTLNETINILRIEYLPQKLQTAFNEDNSTIYSYLQLRNEIKLLALDYQEIGNIDINKISRQLKFPPETIQREIEYLILEGKINPRLVGRT